MTKTIHPNSRHAWRQFPKQNRSHQVMNAFANHGPMTDRQVCDVLGSQDMNHARPAITRLTQQDILIEVDRVKCPVTGHRVRLTDLDPQYKENVSC